MILSDKFGECEVECERGHTFEPPCQYRMVPTYALLGTDYNEEHERYYRIKSSVLGTLPERLAGLIDRTENSDDAVLLAQVRERLDALAGDTAYHMMTEDR